MKLLDSLRAEHVLIEQVVGSLQTFAAARAHGAPAVDGEAFLRFFRLYAGRFHHGREEGVLLRALVEQTEAPERGPIAAIVGQHRSMERLLEEIEPLATAEVVGTEEASRLAALCARYGEALLRHIDAENSVLFLESEARFRAASVGELEDRAPDADEEAARAEGEHLVQRHRPQELPGVIRGDGCPGCPSYGVDCDGVEREWASELEWEDMKDRIG